MRWWLRSRRVAAVGMALLLQLALLAALGDAMLSRVPAVVLVPLIVAVVARYMLEAVEPAAVRRVGVLDGALIATFLALVAVVGALAGLLGAPLAHEATRNAAGFTGLALLAGPRIGAAVPAADVVLLAALEVSRPRVAEVWGWPLQDRSSVVAAAIAGALALAGLARTVRRG